MTLTLTPDMEAQVRSVAETHGLDPQEALIALLNQALAEADFTAIVMTKKEIQEVSAALRKSEEDFAAGRWVSLEDYEAQTKERRRALPASGVAA